MKNEIIKIDDKVYINDDTKTELVEDINVDNINETCEVENYIEQIDKELDNCEKKTDVIYKKRKDLFISSAFSVYLGLLIYLCPACCIGIQSLMIGKVAANFGLFTMIALPMSSLCVLTTIYNYKKKVKKLNIEEGEVDSLKIYLGKKKEKGISKLKSLKEKNKKVTTSFKKENICKDNLSVLANDVDYYNNLVTNPIEIEKFYSSTTPITDEEEYELISSSLDETIKQKKLTLLPKEK